MKNKCLHDFIPVISFNTPFHSATHDSIRWCTKCGTVRVDIQKDIIVNDKPYIERTQRSFSLIGEQVCR